LAIAASIAISIWAAAPARAADQAIGAADSAAIRQVIENQLNAFQRDDGVKAFSYAAPTIRDIFQSPENFMNMVRSGYAPVYRPRKVEFGAIDTIDGSPVQHVFVVGPDGTNVDALYYMEREPDGSWRIKGCELKASYQA
jgi:hypothetical protein